jgi:hypothetical protein
MIRTARLLLLSAAPLLLAAPLRSQSPTLLELSSASGDRLIVDSAGGLLVLGAPGIGAIPATGAGARLMWYPGRAAFRAGLATETVWNDGNVGEGSFAVGHATRASGATSTAMGSATIASGGISTAMGGGTTAAGDWSTAMGSSTAAGGSSSTAMGSSTTAGGGASTAMGSGTSASGGISTAMGQNTLASGGASTAMGFGTTASGAASTALGTQTTASGNYSTAMGAQTTASGNYSTAMGRSASTSARQGAFVYGDNSTATVMNANADNQFSVRAAGGVRLFTNSGLTTGATLSAGGSSWNTVSDRHRKEEFRVVDGEEILSRIRLLPVTTWRYIAEEDRSVRHIGPMAQDWDRAFGFSGDSLTINSGDFHGVNLAGVQALMARTDALRAENGVLRDRVDLLERENGALRTRLERLEEVLGVGRGP